ncbi:hypothetical protein [Pseudomonas carnis]|jgi:hypothetical protein|uniref:hypothetical protein n=1 Tax=Pseudomonas carnis TaxID=2487355 RepID=UPI0039B02E89
MKECPILFSAMTAPLPGLNTIRNKCNKSKAHSNHQKCSKQRPTEGIARRTREKSQ